MDCNMPIMDGFKATKIICKKIKEGELEAIPIIGLSAYSEAYRDPCLKAGMIDYCKETN
jgi:CheY-like chemotaxis protein